MFALEKFRDAARAERMADVCGGVAHDAGEEVDVADGMAFDDVFEYDAAVEVCEVLEHGAIVIEVREERHAAVREIRAPARVAGFVRVGDAVFGERERIDGKSDIAAGEQRSKLTRE